jgi:hypothetical protein
MSFNGQARSGSITWRRMLCSRCIPADLLPESVLTVNIEILRVTNIMIAADSPARARLPSESPSTLSSDDDARGQRRTPSPESEDASVNSGASDGQDLLDSSPGQ